MSITAESIPGYTTGTWKLDPTHSELTFTVRHLAISKVRGTFRTWDATIVTTDDVENPQVTVEIDVASIDTNQADRDNHLRTGDFFAADEFPKFTFVSTKLTHDGNDFVLAGDLTLRGVTKPVEIKGDFNGVITDPYGQTKAGAEGKLTINRKDFGVNWNAALETGGFMLGDDVTITIEAQFVLQAAE